MLNMVWLIKQSVQFKKSREEIKSAQVMKGISKLSSSHNITEQMEILLLVLINEKQMAGDSFRRLFVKRPNNYLRNLVLRLLVQVLVL